MLRHPLWRGAVRVLAAVAITATVTSLAPSSATAAPSITVSKVAGGFSRPTQVTYANDGSNRLFVVEQRGTIRVVKNGKKQSGYFLDIRSKVGTGGERGLLGLAFDPAFKANRTFYVYYTGGGGDVIIARYKTNERRTWASAKSERRVLRVEHSKASNHNGGGMAFGPDGYLYAGIGDGGGAGDPEGDSRNIRRNLLGKLIRIDVHGTGSGRYDRYGIPPSNPYKGSKPGLGEIWAKGLRNPWRISFDRATGALYVADVGQSRREEVNRQPKGAKGGRDYGWNIMEGRTCYRSSKCPLAGDTLPVMEYTHAGGNCAITGGYVYRGSAYPSLRGRYVFGDYCSGRIWTIPSVGSNLAEQQAAHTSLTITSFGEDQAGELYLVSGDGGLYRLRA